MDTRTGEIAPLSVLKDKKVPNRYVVEIDEKNLTEMQRVALAAGKRVKLGRNDPCACGSGIKFKKCCLNKGV